MLHDTSLLKYAKENYETEYNFGDIVGQTFTSMLNHEDEFLIFRTSEGVVYKMWHYQNCCESVTLNDICGEFGDILGSPILRAETVSSSNQGAPLDRYDESWTWTFYKIDTIKGGVTLRWYGSSNGYYSEEVNFCKAEIDDENETVH